MRYNSFGTNKRFASKNTMKTGFITDSVSSPVGELYYLVTLDGALKALSWDLSHVTRVSAALGGSVRGKNPHNVSGTLTAYFDGELAAIERLKSGADGTEFQRKVWQQLRAIGAGKTDTYGAIAARVGNPKACRAVGMANRTNPVAIVVPCHRVIGKDGSLTGYAGGFERKKILLAHESKFSINTLTLVRDPNASKSSTSKSKR